MSREFVIPVGSLILENLTKMNLTIHTMQFSGTLLDRGYWLYIWRVTCGSQLFIYVGRTGDSSSNNAGSPFTRIGNHLDSRPTARGNSLWRLLIKEKVDPHKCKFEMTAIGPIFNEEKDTIGHRQRRDQMAGLERDVARHLKARGLAVLGIHHSRKHSEPALVNSVISIINKYF
jgi:hypothetical protein